MKIEQLNPLKTKIEPLLVVSSLAEYKQRMFVQIGQDEVSWFGLIKKYDCEESKENPHLYYLKDVFLIEQEVTAGTTEISGEDLGKFAVKMMQEGKEDDLDYLLYWGHSHVDFAVSPSTVDVTSLRELSSNCEHFIAGILNKKGDAHYDLALKGENLKLCGIDFEVETEYDDLEDGIREEFKEKVSKAPPPPPRVVTLPYTPQGRFPQVHHESTLGIELTEAEIEAMIEQDYNSQERLYNQGERDNDY